jgi:hypothetical protein
MCTVITYVDSSTSVKYPSLMKLVVERHRKSDFKDIDIWLGSLGTWLGTFTCTCKDMITCRFL